MSGAHLSAPQGSSRFHTPAPRQRFAAFFRFDFSFDLDVQAKNPCRNLEPNNAWLLRPALTAHPNRLRQHAAARASRRPCRASAATSDLPVVGRLSRILLDVEARERLSGRKIACA
jgi:hypothetical protein